MAKIVDHKYSINPSITTRRLFDLKQCLHITAAFEYYHRSFLPEISSETTIHVYEEIRDLIQKYTDTQSGKKRRKAVRLLNSLVPTISLQDKLCKTYLGYANWPGTNTILAEYFGDDVTELASIANKWRNELAHEKREYEPDKRVISAIRLVEHLNYCIILRMAGYSDENIKAIVEEILAR